MRGREGKCKQRDDGPSYNMLLRKMKEHKHRTLKNPNDGEQVDAKEEEKKENQEEAAREY